MIRKTTDEFIDDAKKIHGNKYDYSLVDYKTTRFKVKIICPEHGIFEQLPHAHVGGNQGCPYCSGRHKSTKDEFINKGLKIHGEKYDYSLVDYINNKTPVKIICSVHGVFEQRPDSHIKCGCKKCGEDIKKLKLDEFINKSKKIHDDKYDYSLVNYINSYSKIKIICPEHGVFEQTPHSHSRGAGCPICKQSIGEKKVGKLLSQNNVYYIDQYKFNDCKDKKTLIFDFYLPEKNICIEFDGIQHFKPIEFFGGEEYLKKIKKRDKIKNIYCKEKKIKLIRIRNKKEISEKLSFLFNI